MAAYILAEEGGAYDLDPVILEMDMIISDKLRNGGNNNGKKRSVKVYAQSGYKYIVHNPRRSLRFSETCTPESSFRVSEKQIRKSSSGVWWSGKDK